MKRKRKNLNGGEEGEDQDVQVKSMYRLRFVHRWLSRNMTLPLLHSMSVCIVSLSCGCREGEDDELEGKMGPNFARGLARYRQIA